LNVEATYNHLLEGNPLSLEDRKEFDVTSIEHLLNLMSQQYRALFHATCERIPNGDLLHLVPLRPEHKLVNVGKEASGTPTAFAANYATILIIKALFSNKYGLNYSYNQINQLGLNKIDDGVVNDKGFIYLLKDTESFRDTYYSFWEKYTTIPQAQFAGAIVVTLDDLPLGLKVYEKRRLLSVDELRRNAH